MAYYRPARWEDIAALAPTIREQDRTEIWHSHGMTPQEGLEFSFDKAVEAHSIISDKEEVIGMFGVGEVAPRIGVPWLLASDELPKVQRQFLPESLKWVNKVNDQYDLLFNYVYAGNTVSIRWLKWLGFSFIQKIDNWGVHPAPFIEFARHKGT